VCRENRRAAKEATSGSGRSLIGKNHFKKQGYRGTEGKLGKALKGNSWWSYDPLLKGDRMLCWEKYSASCLGF
jgi:hypothetical protein